MFVGREQELARLERAWQSDRAELIVVYGRRRVGKTALLRRFCADRPHVFWVASLSAEALLRRSWTETLWRQAHPGQTGPGFTYHTWERCFQALAELGAADERLVVVLDEFPYLVSADTAAPSILQKVWDERLQHSRLMLILCGSHIGMMEREVMAYRAPLYGRRTGQIHLRPLPLRGAAEFFPRYSPVEQIEAYAILGGTPAYLRLFDDRRSLITNVTEQILDPGGYLYAEPPLLLREELREPRNYFAILQAIAQGRTQLTEISQATGIERQPTSRYLAILQDLQLIERRVPITEAAPDKSRKGIYRLREPFLRFWFRHVAPNVSILEDGLIEPIARGVVEDLARYLGPAFEDLCAAWVVEQAALGRLPLVPRRVGGWWSPAGEIDVVALGDGAVLFGECKWTERPVGTNILDDLVRKAAPLTERMGWGRAHYALFAKSGFTPELRRRAEAVWLVAAEDVVRGAEANPPAE
jgi:hypothetical protein